MKSEEQRFFFMEIVCMKKLYDTTIQVSGTVHNGSEAFQPQNIIGYMPITVRVLLQ